MNLNEENSNDENYVPSWKKGMWKNEQEWRDLVICQLVWLRLDRLNRALGLAKGTPLSVRIEQGKPKSLKARSNTVKA